MFSIFPLLSSFLNLINIPSQGGIHLASANLFRTFPVTSTPITEFLYHISTTCCCSQRHQALISRRNNTLTRCKDLRLSPAGALRLAGRLVFLKSGKLCQAEFETSAQAFLLNPADEWKSIFNCVHPEALWHIVANQKLLCDANCFKRQLISQPHRIQRAAADNTAFPSPRENCWTGDI